jgi:hypothetical protein
MYTSMFRKAMLGDTATLNLDFSSGSLPSAVTFTRADSTARATFINASGYVQTVASAGAARFDYTGGVAKGLLIEAAATNKIYGSESLAASGLAVNWQFSEQVTRNSTLVTSPRGTDDAVTVNETTANNIHRTGQFGSPGFTAGDVCTFSCWAKVAKSSTPRKLFVNTTQAMGSSGLFDLTATGTSGTAQATAGTAVNRATSWTKYPNDWYRITVTGNWVSDSTLRLQINRASSSVATDDSFTGEADNGIIIWGAQFELGNTASSYIITGASSLTRLADDAVIRSTAWTSLYSKPGTIVVEYYRGEYGAGDRSVLAIDTAITKHIHLKHANASAASGIYNSAGLAVITKMTGNAAGLNKAAFNWSSANPSNIKYALNGNALVVGATSDILATLGTWMNIGSSSTTGVSGSGTWEGYLNNSIKSVKYYSELLTDAEMIAKTT